VSAVDEPKTRQANGESWISEKPNTRGYYEAFVWMGTKPDGKPDRRHVERKTITAVKSRVRELERERDAGLSTKPGRKPTVEQMLTRHLMIVLPQRGRAPRTIADYWSKCRNDIFPRWGGQKIDRLRADQIEDGCAEMITDGHKPSHVVKVLAILSSAYEIEVKRGNVARNPCSLVEAPEIGDPELASLTRAQIRAVLDTVRNRRNSARWSVGLACGLRQGEALGMRWQYLVASCTECERTAPATECWGKRKTPRCPSCGGDVVFEIRAWFQLQRLTWAHGCADTVIQSMRKKGASQKDTDKAVRQAEHECGARYHKVRPCPDQCKQHKRACPPPCPSDCTDHARHCLKKKLPAGLTPVAGGLVLREIKERRKKTIPIPAELADMLRAQHAAQAAGKLAIGDLWEEHDLVFSGPDGRPLDPRDDWQEWSDILAAAGVPHHGVHAARHSAATIAIDEGIALSVVQEMLGHSDIRVTRAYVHTSSPVARDAASRMGSALFGGGPKTRTAPKTAPKRRKASS
jgi:integrase